MDMFTTQETLLTFFDKFCEDFVTFNGTLIASRYTHPYSSVSASGEITLLNSRTEIADYFQAILNNYHAQNIVSCQYSDLEWLLTGSRTLLATVKWEMLDVNSKPVSKWRESYNLLQTDDNLKIYASADFAS